ncbi:putative Oligosaccharide translocase (Flippase) [Candidatus Sulfotelmatobacter kueseliae]|uniref:Putative Oligosaccharide translocase (Flippase) n=1 Tax=Candidatus Sulfotelmatobacter kueseliae TaxID=2042962 RepID=A0A2U3KKJ8_9BACT|nr:putative Oligosaccharide translocase (Flippase) [Candidatus Sulfotelmatobacter kueseliae]
MSNRARTFRNVIYSSLTKGTTLICIAVTSSVVARNLSPSDYGVIGFATIIIGFLSHFSDVGVASAAIRRPALDQHSLRAAFTLKIILSFGACTAAFLIAPFAHHFFEHPQTANVVRVLAVEFLVSTIGFMSLVTLIREQNYRALVIPGLASAIVRCVLAVTLILWGWKYWAVVCADVGGVLAASVATQLARRITIRFRFDLTDWQEYLRFGVPLLGSGVLIFLVMNLDNFLVGSRLGSTQLGYYALAFTWGSFICGLLYDTVNNVLFPAFSALQNDAAAMRRWYLKTIDLIAFVAVVANTALLANTHFFLVTFLGKGTDKWVPAAMALKILCVYGIVRAITEPLSNCVMALGKTKSLLHANALAGGLELLLFLVVLRTGRIELVAGAVFVAYVSQSIIYLPFLRRNLDIGTGEIAAQLWPVIPALAGGYIITSLLPVSLGGTFFTLACRGLFSALVAASIHGLCTRFRCFQEAGGMISQNLARVRA